MKNWKVIVVVVAALLAAGAAATATEKDASGKVWSLAPSAIQWVQDKEMPQISKHVLWGDPTKGPYGAFLKFAAGLELPLHWHTFDNRGTLVAGTLSIEVDGKEHVASEPGSFLFVAGKAQHVTRCKGSTDCVIFVDQPGMDDMHPVETKKK